MSETMSAEEFRITTGRNETGADVFGFLVKRAYRITPAGTCERDETPPFRATDEYWDDDPETASPRFESEITACKTATDVVVLGHVHAPGGSATTCAAAIEIGATRKIIAVFGDRLATSTGQSITFSAPEPFSKLPLVFERAYGGPCYPRNPVGCGFITGAMPPHPVILPNFEDPSDLLTPETLLVADPKHWNRQKLPQGMGWFGKAWYPRSSYAGIIPANVDSTETMREEALGLVPKNQIALGRRFRLPSWDIRFANGAAPGLAIPNLTGTETIRLLNLTPDHRLAFRLPADKPTIIADIGAGESQPEPRLHSIIIEPDESRVTLIWGATLPYQGAAWLPHMKRLSGYVRC